MAISYTIREAVKIIADNAEPEKIMDIGKRYPLLLNAVTRCATKAGSDFVDFVQYIPEYVTANKINQAMKREIDGDDAEDNSSEPEEQEKPRGVVEPASKSDRPRRRPGRPRKVQEPEPEPEADEQDDEQPSNVGETDELDYSSMPAPKLYKLCTKRGIDAQPKKPAKYYIDLLEKADSGEPEAEDQDDDDEWDI